MAKKHLEAICTEVENKKWRYFSKKRIVKKAGLKESNPQLEKYVEFIKKYSTLARDYHFDKGTLESKLNKGINYWRVGKNTLWSAVLGSSLGSTPYSATVGALIGLGLNLYDEKESKGMDLSKVWWSTFLGGIIGGLGLVLWDHFISGPLPESVYKETLNIMSYVGGIIGCSLGVLASKKNAKPKEKLSKEELEASIKRLDEEYNTKKNDLIDYTLKTISSEGLLYAPAKENL